MYYVKALLLGLFFMSISIVNATQVNRWKEACSVSTTYDYAGYDVLGGGPLDITKAAGLGSELVADGEFAQSDTWTYDGWEWVVDWEGKSNYWARKVYEGEIGTLSQSLAITAGKSYILSLGNSIPPSFSYLGGTELVWTQVSAYSFKTTCIAGSSDALLRFVAGEWEDGVIDSVSVQEYVPDYVILSHSSSSRNCNLRVRYVGDDSSTVSVFNLYSGTLTSRATTCDLSFLGTLTFEVGGQLSDIAGYYFADNLTIEDAVLLGWSSKSPDGDRVAEGRIKLDGENVIVIVPTTVGCNGKLLFKYN